MEKSYRHLERVVRGFANHRRIQVLELLAGRPELERFERPSSFEILARVTELRLLGVGTSPIC